MKFTDKKKQECLSRAPCAFAARAPGAVINVGPELVVEVERRGRPAFALQVAGHLIAVLK